MKKRLSTFVMAICMVVSLLAVPAGAAGAATVTFSDVGDRRSPCGCWGCWTATATAPSARARC